MSPGSGGMAVGVIGVPVVVTEGNGGCGGGNGFKRGEANSSFDDGRLFGSGSVRLRIKLACEGERERESELVSVGCRVQ